MAVVSFLSLLGLLVEFRDDPKMLAVMGSTVPSVILVSWGLELLCVYFHPERGRLATGQSPRSGTKVFKTMRRAIYALLISVMFLIGIIVLPFHALLRLVN